MISESGQDSLIHLEDDAINQYLLQYLSKYAVTAVFTNVWKWENLYSDSVICELYKPIFGKGLFPLCSISLCELCTGFSIIFNGQRRDCTLKFQKESKSVCLFFPQNVKLVD